MGGSYIPEINDIVNTAMAAALGGTFEALGGGKFANGAVTGKGEFKILPETLMNL